MKTATKLKKALAVLLVTLLALTPLSLLSFAADSIDLSGATYYTFSDTNNALTIKSAGTYVVSGTCTNGTIVVKKNVTGVTLVLSGLTLTASATAPITVGKGSDVTIYANATILGGETTVGARSVIGSNVWLTHSVPPDTRVLFVQPDLRIKTKSE